MTPLMITLLIVAGITLLIVIGYLNNEVENNKLDQARLKIELTERLHRCGEITETFPGQLMTSALKRLLTRLELNLNQRLQAQERNSAAYKERIVELGTLIGKGLSIPVNNPPSPIQTEAKAKEVRHLLKDLHDQVIRATQEGFLATRETRLWIREIRHILVRLHIELFNNLGQQALQQGQPGLAQLAFERGIQYLHKQSEPLAYEEQLTYLEKLLARANSRVLASIAPQDDGAEPSPLRASHGESERFAMATSTVSSRSGAEKYPPDARAPPDPTP